MQLSERFVNQCSPVIGLNNPTCGTITRASIAHLTPSQLNTIFTPGGLFADLDAWFVHQIEMRACGIQRYAFYDWIYANADRTTFKSAVSGQKVVKGPGLLYPFIMGRQESVINKDYWRVVNSFPLDNYTVNEPMTDKELSNTDDVPGVTYAGPLESITGTDAGIILRVDNRHNIPMDPNWFRPGDVITVFTQENGVTKQGNWKVVRAAVDSYLTYIDVLVDNANAGSTTPYTARPRTGVIVLGVNNVNDYETWCHNLPTIDPRKRVPFWWQTFRNSRCVDEEYRTVFNRLRESNIAFREFGDLPLAEQNRQDEREAQRRFVHSFLFNKPISTNQTLTNWQSLADIVTPAGAVINNGMTGKVIGKRANFIGVKEQLRTCDRVIDVQGNALNLIEFFELNYDIARYRKTGGRKVTEIDWFCSDTFRANFQTAMMAYYNTQYAGMLQLNCELGKMQEQLGMVYDSYKVKFPAGIKINIISDEFFNDLADEMAANNIETAGNLLLCLDIGLPPNGSIYWAQIAANRKVYTNAKIDELAKFDSTYRCVMASLSQEQSLTSESGTVVVECPKWSAWIEGFANVPPVATGRSANPSYQNLY